MTQTQRTHRLTRRRFLQSAAVGLGAGLGVVRPTSHALGAADVDDAPATEPFSFGLVTDVHYADAPTNGTRYYRDSLDKLRAAVETFNREKPAFVAELGDLIDAGPTKDDALRYLRAVREVLEELRCPRYYVLGNHCVDQLTKAEFLANCGATIQESCYSFDAGRYHFVALDADFKNDGAAYAPGNFVWTDTSIPKSQQDWLAEDLQKAGDRKTIVFVHQRLDADRTDENVDNAAEVRAVLEKAGNVLAVFQGHLHSGGATKIGGIHYRTLRAMIEGPKADNAYALVTLDAENRVAVKGFGRQPSVKFE